MRTIRGISSAEAFGSAELTFSGAIVNLSGASIDNDVGDTDGPHAGLITLTGATGLSEGGLVVEIGGVAALDLTILDDTSCTFRPPALSAGLHDIDVTNTYGGDTLPAAYRAWSPALIASATVQGYYDARKDVTGTSPITGWTNQVDAEDLVQEGSGAALVADYFGTGVPAVHFTGVGAFARPSSLRHTNANGTTRFWVGEHTETALETTQYNPRMTAIGEQLGSVYQGAGMRGPMLEYGIYTSGWQRQTRGYYLNDGQPRLMGFTHSSAGSLRGYVDGEQIGDEMRTDGYTSVPYPGASAGWSAIGVGYPGAADYLIGHYGAFVVCDDVIDATERGYLTKWARLSFGTVAKPAETALDFSPRAAWVQGNYVNAGTGQWPNRTLPQIFPSYTEAQGRADQGGSPGPAAVGGAPDSEYDTDWPLTSSIILGDCVQSVGHHMLVAVSLESIATTSTNRFENHSWLKDASSYSCIYVWNNGGSYYAGIYCWDGAQKYAEVDVTALLSGGGAGDLIIVGKREAGTLSVRARRGDGTGDTGWVAGNASGAPSALSGVISALGDPTRTPDGITRASMIWNYPLSSYESDAAMAWAEGLFP